MAAVDGTGDRLAAAAAPEHMLHALRLARRGLYTTTPNPRVGCVLVRDGRVVGSAWHVRAGEPHAEALALAAAGTAARGADCYVTLEPCAHHGRTPPCADALIRAGVRRVFASMADPNPRVAGAGLARLRAAGIEVHLGQYAAAAWELNRGFCTRHERGRPWFRLKVASSADGRVGIKGGNNRWITGSAARRDVHRLRAQSCAVLTASGTVLADDPELTVRHVKTPRQPTRVVLDRRASVPASARIFSAAAPLLLVHAEALEGRQSGIPSCFLPVAEDGIDLAALARELARREFNEVLVEAGPRINAAFVASGLVDEIVLYLAPSLLGADALASFALHGLADVNAAPRFNLHEVRRVGEDLRLGFRQRP